MDHVRRDVVRRGVQPRRERRDLLVEEKKKRKRVTG